MARPKKHPRFNGRIELHRGVTFSKLNLDKVDRKDIGKLDEILTSFLSTCQKWWWIETGYTLKIVEDEGNYLVWTVEDTRDASMVFHWLKSKAGKYEGRIVQRINYLIKEGLCGEGDIT